LAQDIVCVTSNDNCVDPFKFLGVTQQLGLPPQISGVLGLALGNKVLETDVDLQDQKIEDKFIDFLYMAGGMFEK